MPETLEERYARLCAGPNDISEHLPVLRDLAERCRHVTELGVRSGNSTTAFMAAEPDVLVSVDVHGPPPLWSLAPPGTDWRFIEADTREIVLGPTDLLFIDTWHVYRQLRAELRRHGNVARKYLVLHDTRTFGPHGEDYGKGLLEALGEWLCWAPDWSISLMCPKQNGLTVLERTGP